MGLVKLSPELSSAMIPCVLTPSALKLERDEPTPGFQPTIVPSSVAKRKRAGAEVFAPSASTPEIMNPGNLGLLGSLKGLKTVPVGAPLLPKGSPGVGMLTTRTGTGGVTEFGALAGTL